MPKSRLPSKNNPRPPARAPGPAAGADVASSNSDALDEMGSAVDETSQDGLDAGGQGTAPVPPAPPAPPPAGPPAAGAPDPSAAGDPAALAAAGIRAQWESLASEAYLASVRVERTEFGLFEVHPYVQLPLPEAIAFLSFPPLNAGHEKIQEPVFLERKARHQAKRATGEAIVAAARGANDWKALYDARILWEGKDPQLLAELLREPWFLGNEVWAERPELLGALERRMDPVFALRESLRSKIGEPILIEIRDWSARFDATAREEAKLDAFVSLKLKGLTDYQMVLALQYLTNGGESDGPRDEIARALASGDAARFQDAWRKALADPALLDSYKDDANFLHRVQSLGDEMVTYVQVGLEFGGAAAKNADMKLTPEEEDKIQGFATDACRAMAVELEATFKTYDQPVLDAARTYFVSVGSILQNVTDADVRRVKMELARGVLKSTYRDYYGADLAYRMTCGMGDPALPLALALIDSDPDARAKAGVAEQAAARIASAGASARAAQDEPQDTLPPLTLTDEERRLLDVPRATCASRIAAEVAKPFYSPADDATMLGALRDFENLVALHVQAQDDRNLAHVFARDRRRADAMLWLEDYYPTVDPAGRSLQEALTSYMSGNDEEEASGVLAAAHAAQAKKPEDWGTYSEEPSAAEDQRIDQVARQHASRLAETLAGAPILGVGVSDSEVLGILERARGEMRSALRPRSTQAITADVQLTWNGKVDAGMARIKQSYDDVYGSLVADLYDHVQDDAARRACLRYVGHTADYTRKVADEAIAGVQGGADLDYVQKMDELRPKVIAVAERIWAALDSTFVTATDVLSVCETFGRLRADYALLTRSETFGAGGFLRMLEQAFQPLGGSLGHALANGLDETSAKTAFLRLGIEQTPLSFKVDSDATLDADTQEAQRRLLPIAERAFHAAEVIDVVPPEHRATQRARVADLFGQAAKLAGTSLLERTWTWRFGIDLQTWLARTLHDAGTLGRITGALGLPAIAVKSAADVRSEESARDAEEAKELRGLGAAGQLPPELDWDPLQTGGDFNLNEAIDRARQLHEAAGRGDRHALTRLLAGNAEKNRVVEEIFRRLYGYEIRFRLHQGLRDADAVKEYDRLVATGGAESDFGQELLGDTAHGSLQVVYEKVQRASADKRGQALGNPELLHAMRKAFGEEPYERIYRSLTGELTLGDMLRTRDEGTSWYQILGAGTDEAGAESDLKLFFETFKQREEQRLAVASKRGAEKQAAVQEVSSAMRDKARALLRDPEVVTILEQEFGSDELLKMKQLVMGGGQQSGTDTVLADLEGLGTGDDLLKNLRAMSDQERKQFRDDPISMAALLRDVSGSEREEALRVLGGAKGKDADADIHAAISGADVDEHKLFEVVLALDAEQLHALAADPFRVREIRARLDDNEEERKLFDALMKGARQEVGAGAPAGADPAAVQQRARQRQQAHLVLTHTVALKHGAYEGTDHLLAAAQAVYAEKGEFQDPTRAKEAPDPDADPEARQRPQPTEELFGPTQRHEVFVATLQVVAAEVKGGIEGPFFKAVEDAILGRRDPSGFRLEYGFSGIDSDSAVRGAIAAAPATQVATRWSNVLKPGPTWGTASLLDRYAAWVRARTEHAAVEADPGATAEAKKASRDAANLAEDAFRRHRLDVSADLLDVLVQREPGSLNPFEGTGEKDLLSYKNAVRDRILGLSNEDVSDALKQHQQQVAEASPDSVPGTRASEVVQALDAEGTKVFVNEDRKVRSQVEHRADQYDQQRADGSVANAFTSTEEILDLEYQRMLGDLGVAEAGSSEQGEVGRVSEEEQAGLKERLAAFDVALTEYQAAKSAVASVMKWVAIMVIGAVATALTGPGGATLFAAMLQAAATAGASAIIDEAVMGRDYEFWQEGVKQVAIDTALAAVTFGFSYGWQQFGANNRMLGPLADKWARFQAWEKALAEGAGNSVGDFGLYLLESGGRSALEAAVGQLKDPAVALLDLSAWKYGWNQGAGNFENILAAQMAGMDDAMLEAFLTTMATNSAAVLKGKLLPEDPKKKALPGVEMPEGPERTKGAWESLTDGGALDPKVMLGDLYDQASSTLLDKLKGGDIARSSGWNESDIDGFLSAFLKSRVTKGVDNVASAYQDARNKQLAAEALARFTGQVDAQLSSLPEDERDAAKAHFKHFLQSGVTDFDKAVSQWRGSYDQLRGQISRNGGDGPAGREYRAWVLSDPTRAAERATFGREEYAKARTRANALILKVQQAQGSDAPLLRGEELAFWDHVISNPDNLLQLEATQWAGWDQPGTIQVRPDLDITTPEGVAAFKTMFVQTKRALILAHAAPMIADWPEDKRKAFEEHVRSASPAVLPDLGNPASPAMVSGAVGFDVAMFHYDPSPAPAKRPPPPPPPRASAPAPARSSSREQAPEQPVADEWRYRLPEETPPPPPPPPPAPARES